jgi:inhibitor of the pro-sigma K processing machinery
MGKVFLIILFFLYVFVIVITMIKSKRFFTVMFLSVLQGISALFTINLLGQYLAIHLPINLSTISVSSIGGVSGVIMLLLCDAFLV